MSLKTTGLERTASSESGDQDKASNLGNAPVHSQVRVVKHTQQIIPGKLTASFPTIQSDDMLKCQERLANNRRRARIRRKQQQSSTETKLRCANELQSRNDDLRKKNQALIRELARYGVMYSDAPTSTPNQTSSALDTSPLISLCMVQQQPTVVEEDATRIASNGSSDLNSRPLRNGGNGASPPLTLPTSIHDTMISCGRDLQQMMDDNRRRFHHRLQQEQAALSSLFKTTPQPSAHLLYGLNNHASNNIPSIGSRVIERSEQPFLPSNTIANIRGDQEQQYQQHHASNNIPIVRSRVIERSEQLFLPSNTIANIMGDQKQQQQQQ